MESKKTFFNYIGQVFTLYGMIVTIFLIFGVTVGRYASEYSSLFAFSKEGGFSISTLFQLFLFAIAVTVAQVVFFTDVCIKHMKLPLRIICFFAFVIAVMVGFAIAFAWFPVHDVRAWVGFGVSFFVCTAISVAIGRWKEHVENRKMEEALQKFQEK